jgi:hypothetical protein
VYEVDALLRGSTDPHPLARESKAVPRDWLVAGEALLVANRVTMRYGRISLSLEVAAGATYAVKANITLPPSFGTKAPTGGIKLRIRAPLAHAGKLSKVMVGGQASRRGAALTWWRRRLIFRRAS